MSREFLSQRVGGLALTESTAVQQQFRHERDDDEENPDTFEERDTQGIYDARHGAVVEYDSNDDDYDDAGYGGDDADEEEDSFDALDATNSAFIAAHSRESAAAASVASASSLEWCAAYLERDDLIDLDGAEDEELVDLRREYGAPLSNAVEHLPTLTSRLQAPPRPDDEKQLSLLREGDESVEDDWDMLGIECDCPCASCRHTFVATDYDLFQQRLAEDASADSSDECECECLCFDPPSSTHAVILDLLEDFLRFRVHLHRVTFATAMDQAQRRAARLAPPDQDRLCRTQYARSLTLLKARARRDLKHLELLEVCANQLGWNQADSPTFSTVAVFCEVSPPGPSLLCGIVIEFLSYFLVHRTTASNFDKTKMATLCSNLALFAVKTGDIESGHAHTPPSRARACNTEPKENRKRGRVRSRRAIAHDLLPAFLSCTPFCLSPSAPPIVRRRSACVCAIGAFWICHSPISSRRRSIGTFKIAPIVWPLRRMPPPPLPPPPPCPRVSRSRRYRMRSSFPTPPSTGPRVIRSFKGTGSSSRSRRSTKMRPRDAHIIIAQPLSMLRHYSDYNRPSTPSRRWPSIVRWRRANKGGRRLQLQLLHRRMSRPPPRWWCHLLPPPPPPPSRARTPSPCWCRRSC